MNMSFEYSRYMTYIYTYSADLAVPYHVYVYLVPKNTCTCAQGCHKNSMKEGIDEATNEEYLYPVDTSFLIPHCSLLLKPWLPML